MSAWVHRLNAGSGPVAPAYREYGSTLSVRKRRHMMQHRYRGCAYRGPSLEVNLILTGAMMIRERLLSPFAGVEVERASECANLEDAIASYLRDYGMVALRDVGLSRERYVDMCSLIGDPVPPPFLEEVKQG